MRAFVAIDIPPPVRAALERLLDGLPFGRPVDTEQLHLTLAFLGEQSDDLIETAHHALGDIRCPVFDLQLQGLGSFSAEVLWAGVRETAPVAALQSKVVSALHGAGITLERRRFRPHVTIARSPRPDAPRLATFLAAHEAFPAPSFPVTHFGLWHSTLSRSGAVHEQLARYPLTGAPPDFG